MLEVSEKNEMPEKVLAPTMENLLFKKIEPTTVEPPKKRTRKQSEPKHLEEVTTGVAADLKRKRKQEKEQEEIDRIKNMVTVMAKKQKNKVIYNPLTDEKFKKDLTDPSIIKSYCLPLFYFLGVPEIIVDDSANFSSFFIVTKDGFKKLAKMKKNLPAYDISEEEFQLLSSKFARDYFKINERDYKKLRSLISMKEDSDIRMILVDILKSEFPNKLGEGNITCLTPVVRFELC